AQACHLAHDQIVGSQFEAHQRLSRQNAAEQSFGRLSARIDYCREVAGLDDERRISSLALAAEDRSFPEPAPNYKALLPKEKLSRHAGKDRVASQLGGRHDLRGPFARP